MRDIVSYYLNRRELHKNVHLTGNWLPQPVRSSVENLQLTSFSGERVLRLRQGMDVHSPHSSSTQVAAADPSKKIKQKASGWTGRKLISAARDLDQRPHPGSSHLQNRGRADDNIPLRRKPLQFSLSTHFLSFLLSRDNHVSSYFHSFSWISPTTD